MKKALLLLLMIILANGVFAQTGNLFGQNTIQIDGGAMSNALSEAEKTSIYHLIDATKARQYDVIINNASSRIAINGKVESDLHTRAKAIMAMMGQIPNNPMATVINHQLLGDFAPRHTAAGVYDDISVKFEVKNKNPVILVIDINRDNGDYKIVSITGK